jgi:hypothetical protein
MCFLPAFFAQRLLAVPSNNVLVLNAAGFDRERGRIENEIISPDGIGVISPFPSRFLAFY